MALIEKCVLAHRCKSAGMNGIFKSYIKDVKVESHRREIDWFLAETDYSFTHKGKRYIVREETVGDKRYSAERKYTAEEIHC